MHTRSKRYLRRHRARLRAQRRTSLKPFLQCNGDNTQFVTINISAVPEPSTWADNLGFAGVGYLAYRQAAVALRRA